MTWEAWITLGVVTLCFALLAHNRYAPDIIMMAGLTLLLVTGIVSPADALSGLANQGIVTVGVLYVIVSGVRETGGIDWIVQWILRRPRSVIDGQLRVMAPVVALSAFLNNTPVVALFIPAVSDWAKRHRLAVSKLMMPLSYAAIAGGTCTLIGTSTNLVVNGLLVAETDLPGLGMFDIAWVGLPAAVIVVVYVVLFSTWLLPERRSATSQFENAREYTVEMLVDPRGPLVGKTIEQAGLRHLPGMYLVEIDREGRLFPAVSPHEVLRGNDRLMFAGIVDSVVDLQKIGGFKPATDQVFKLDSPRHERCLIEAVASNSCPVVGRSIREGRFRSLYNAAVIAVARNGKRINKKIGNIVLRAGDTLLLEAHPSFVAQHQNSRDFYLVSRYPESSPLRRERAWVAVLILMSMVLSVTFGILSMLNAAMVAAGLMIVTRCTTGRIARRAVDWQILVTIAASFGIGMALHKTGAATAISDSIVTLASGSPRLTLGAVFAVTAVLTALATNNVAAVVMFPIALAASGRLGVSFLPFAVSIMVGASASFATPIGYQTNLMVYGPGGYRFTDYLRFGLPLTVIVGCATVLITPIVWPFLPMPPH